MMAMKRGSRFHRAEVVSVMVLGLGRARVRSLADLLVYSMVVPKATSTVAKTDI